MVCVSARSEACSVHWAREQLSLLGQHGMCERWQRMGGVMLVSAAARVTIQLAASTSAASRAIRPWLKPITASV